MEDDEEVLGSPYERSAPARKTFVERFEDEIRLFILMLAVAIVIVAVRTT